MQWTQNRSRIWKILKCFVQYPLMTQWCLMQKLTTCKDSSAQSKETFISWASSVKSTLPQPILLAPLLHIHISVSVMAKISKLVRTSCFSHTPYIYIYIYMTFQYNHLDYIIQGIKLSYMKPLELELSAQNTLQKTWNLNSCPLLCMLFADESQHHTVQRYSRLLAPNS